MNSKRQVRSTRREVPGWNASISSIARSRDRSRSGAALIIAIIVLAALLMLGLPFLFSQSSSLSGTRSFAHAQMARVGGATAEDLGAGAGSYVMHEVLRQSSMIEATTLAHLPSITRIGDNRYAFDLSPRGLGFNQAQPTNMAVIGTVLEDESGKLDPNHMDVAAWERLFAKTGIVDEDDGNGQNRDKDNFKQLAQALAGLRFDPELCPEGRITRLDQLLTAKPQPEKPLVRWPLTRAELQQLKPYLTLAPLGQARAGLIDLGTMIKNKQVNSPNWNAKLDAEPPLNVLAYPLQRDLFGTGSVIVTAKGNQSAGMTGPNGTIPPKYEYGMSTSSDLWTIPDSTVGRGNVYPPSHRPRHEEAVGIEIPAPVNIHQTTAEVRHVLFDVPASAPESPTPATPNGLRLLALPRPDDLNRQLTAFDLQNPLGVYQALGETQVSQTQLRDNNHGLPGMPPAPNGTVTASATDLNISGGQLDRLPGIAFGRIESSAGIEYISYSDSYPDSGRLHNVRRGLPFPGSMGALIHPPPRVTLTIVAPRELPPLAVASQGMLTIEGGTTVSDAAGRQGAQRFRRIIMQTLPHEELLEARWTRQSHLHTLLVARGGSLMSGFPKATQRRLGEQAGELPDERDLPPDPIRPDRSIGVRPAVLRTMVSSSHLDEHRGSNHRWARRFGIEQRGDNPFEMGEDEYPPASTLARDDLTPEGLTITGPISYSLSSPSNPELGFLTRRIRPAAQFDGRQFGMWIKPNAQLTGKSTLFDLRMSGAPGDPLPQQIGPFSGRDPSTAGTGDRFYQNRLNLSYDADTKQLVLTYVNGCIEHINDYGPVCPSETYAFPSGLPVVDPRCLGSQSAPGVTPGLYPLAPKRPLNLVQQRYQLSPTDGLKKNTWYQVQVAMLGNDPGHMAIIVDGIVGREVIRQSSLTCDRFGDHFTLPSLRLKTPLLATPTVQNGGGSSILIPRIELDAIAIDPLGNGTQVVTGAAAVALILPTRGMIRIGNEYISYDELQGAALLKCMRARRQNSVQVGGGTTWVGLEEHKVDDLVVPGGFRFDPQTGSTLWKGGCNLAEPLPNGDPAPMNPEVMNQPYTVWAELRSNGSALNPANVMVPILRNDTPAGTPISIQITNPAVNTWPRRGYARINQTGEIIYYDNGIGPVSNSLNNVQRLQFATMPPPMPPIVWWPASGTPAPTITLLSFEVNGSPAGNYYNPPDPLPAGWADWHLVQIMDPATGRIEWINYNHIDVSKGPGFFLCRRGFRFDPLDRRLGQSSRGQQRTAFAPVDLGGSGAMLTFPANSRVIPVQNERIPRQARAHFISTGDVITIARKSTGAGYQVCVRYASTDGFSLSPSTLPPPNNMPTPSPWDTINEFFAFSDELPENYQINDFQLMSWPAWSGNDLTPSGGIGGRNNNVLPPSTTPWANVMAANFYLGGDDTGNSFLARGNNQNFDGVIDAVFSGNQPGGTLNPNQPNHNDHVAMPFSDPPTGLLLEWNTNALRVDQPAHPSWIDLGDITNKQIVTSAPVFSHQLGLVLIGGEVFAYERQLTPNGHENWHHAKLIGRGLLGSTVSNHSGYEPILTLPIGPVARLIQPVTAALEQEVQISDQRNKQRTRGFNAPTMAFHSPDPRTPGVEIVGTAYEVTAGWLHGMYNTPVKGTWTQIGGLEPLVIGWWPRYPSAVPSQSSQAFSSFKAQALRSRSFSWMGYPLRFRDTFFNRGDALADVTLLSDGDGMFAVKAMALDQGFDWSQAYDAGMTLTAGMGYQDASQAFARFDRKPIDGAELRIVWQYLTAPTQPQADRMGEYLQKIAAAGNTAPMLGKVRVRARAPTRVIQVEEAR